MTNSATRSRGICTSVSANTTGAFDRSKPVTSIRASWSALVPAWIAYGSGKSVLLESGAVSENLRTHPDALCWLISTRTAASWVGTARSVSTSTSKPPACVTFLEQPIEKAKSANASHSHALRRASARPRPWRQGHQHARMGGAPPSDRRVPQGSKECQSLGTHMFRMSLSRLLRPTRRLPNAIRARVSSAVDFTWRQ